MSKKKSRPGRMPPRARSKRNRSHSGASRRSSSQGEDSAKISIDTLTVSEIVGQPRLLGYFETHPLQSLLCQMALLSVVTAGAGTLISKFVPDSSFSDLGHGVYVAGVVVLLFIETIYQWLLRSAVLSIEPGLVTLGVARFHQLSEDQLRSFLERGREENEAQLKRVFEPLQRVGLIAVGLSILSVVQETRGDAPTEWLKILSRDWAMTLMFAFAGLLWQLKNTDNIKKLLEHLKIQHHLTSFGGRFWIWGLVCPTIGSMAVISWCFWPWGLASFTPLLLALYFMRRYSARLSSR